MSRNPKVEQLRKIPLFDHCSKRELAGLAALVDELELPEGQTLAREGERGKEFLVLADGIADVASDGEVVNRLGPGDFFGEISLLEGGPRTATVSAATEIRLLALTAWVFQRIVAQNPKIASKMLKVMAQRLRTSARNLTD